MMAAFHFVLELAGLCESVLRMFSAPAAGDLPEGVEPERRHELRLHGWALREGLLSRCRRSSSASARGAAGVSKDPVTTNLAPGARSSSELLPLLAGAGQELDPARGLPDGEQTFPATAPSV